MLLFFSSRGHEVFLKYSGEFTRNRKGKKEEGYMQQQSQVGFTQNAVTYRNFTYPRPLCFQDTPKPHQEMSIMY